MTSLRRQLSMLILGASFAALAVAPTGCGKAPNDTPVVVQEFPRSLPAAPLRLTASQADDAARTWTSGRALAKGADALWVVDRDNGQVIRLDPSTLTPLTRTDVGLRPEQIVIGPPAVGEVALVTVRESGELVKLDPTGAVVGRVALGGEAWGLALSADGATAFISLPYDDRVVSVDVATLNTIAHYNTLRRPRGLAVTSENQLMVAHQGTHSILLPLGGATDELGGANALPAQAGADANTDDAFVRPLREGNPAEHIEALRLGKIVPMRALAVAPNPVTGGALIAHLQLVPGSAEEFIASQRSITRDGDGGGASGSGASAESNGSDSGDGYGSAGTTRGGTFNIPFRPAEATVTSSDSGGFSQPALAAFPVQDPWTGEPMTQLLDQPSDIHHHPTHTLAFMVGHGSDNVLVLNTADADPMASPVALISVGRAPQSIAFSEDGEMAWVLNSFDFTVSAIDLGPLLDPSTLTEEQAFAAVSGPDGPDGAERGMEPAPDAGDLPTGFGRSGSALMRMHPLRLSAAKSVAFNTDPWPPEVRRGARVFTFARSGRISHAGQFACATCHFEGTEDGQVWFITDGPRQTPALAERLADTAPFNWNGSEELLRNNMARTVGRLGGVGLEAGELDDLEQFMLRGLRAPKNPNISTQGLNDQQRWGESLFNDAKVGCASCHRGEALTNGFSHDVGTASEADLVAVEMRIELGLDPADQPPEFKLNTPSLRGLWYTAPYLHDGSAATLLEVLDKTAYTMGETYQLDDEEKAALVSYLKTL